MIVFSIRILFVFVSAKYLCTNIIRIRIRSFWKNEYFSYLYSFKILIPNNIRIRIRSKKQYSLTSGCDDDDDGGADDDGHLRNKTPQGSENNRDD